MYCRWFSLPAASIARLPGTGRLAAAVLTALLLVGSLPPAAPAAEPALNAIEPQGFQRGTEVEVEFKGARLDDAEQLLLYSPGVTVKELEAANASTVKTTLVIAPDCRLGLHGVRVRTATGVSDLQTFSVGALPEIQEEEPNNDFSDPQPVPLGCTVNGVVQNEDVDYFVVEAKKGQRITAELEGLRLGNTFFDPYLAILNEERFELARSDDAPLLYQDSLCSIIAPEDGKYIIEVRESAYGGSGACKYRLHVGSFPRPTAVFPAGGRPGETLEVTWLGDPAGPWTEQVTLPTDQGSQWGLFAQNDQGVAPSPNVVRIIDLPNVVEAEPNDSPEEATPCSVPAALNGIISEPGDVDHFRFDAKKGQQYDIRVYAREPLRSPLDSVLTVLRSNGSSVASNDDSDGPDSYLRLNVPEDDEYIVVIRDHLGAGGPDYVYRIEITPIQPALTMGLPERTRYVATTLSVPQGNRMALMVAAQRSDFGGELALDIADLPPGLSWETIPMAANRNDVPVLFTADAGASPAGSLADLIGRPVEDKPEVVGHLEQRTWLVRGQNNRDVWGHDADRMAAVVTREIPFHLEIVQPKAPLVRNGSMDLKIVATRAEDFTAPIAVSMLYNPPGVSSSGSITIAEGETEATIPLTANGNAQLNTWKIVVTGRAGTDAGNVEAATQLADLTVAESFFEFAFQKAAAEQGQQASVFVEVENNHEFDGPARVELLGLPAGASSEPLEFTKDSTELVFPVQLEPDARVGNHKSLVCRAVVQVDGEPVTHTLGGGELRIDKPLPMTEPEKPAPPEEEKPAATAKAEEPPPKPLSRLEQLRLAREQEEKDD